MRSVCTCEVWSCNQHPSTPPPPPRPHVFWETRGRLFFVEFATGLLAHTKKHIHDTPAESWRAKQLRQKQLRSEWKRALFLNISSVTSSHLQPSCAECREDEAVDSAERCCSKELDFCAETSGFTMPFGCTTRDQWFLHRCTHLDRDTSAVSPMRRKEEATKLDSTWRATTCWESSTGEDHETQIIGTGTTLVMDTSSTRSAARNQVRHPCIGDGLRLVLLLKLLMMHYEV